MGVALMQTFHVKNLSDLPNSIDNWHFDSFPDFPWIIVMAVGLIMFSYGFLGFWLCERKLKIWRINVHCIFFIKYFKELRDTVFIQFLLPFMTTGSLICIVLFEKDKVGNRIVWATFIVQGFLL